MLGAYGVDRREQRDKNGAADGEMEEDAEGIGLHNAEVGGAGREMKLPGAGGKGRDHGEHAEPADGFAVGGARQHRIDHHDEDAGDGEDDFGKDTGELHLFDLPVVRWTG